MAYWRWYRTKQILSVGCMYRKGKVIDILSWDGGWQITVKYKTVPNRKFYVYH